ncbi:MAG: hypothetical protein E6R03_08485 [Hyphomicrobiaceae bacterium]|nr:MAG: hypothetical protein E6R03_08485 [Hyphomicrobiaceae bacterium]
MTDKEYTLWCSVYLKALDLVAVNGTGPHCQRPAVAAAAAVLDLRYLENNIDRFEQLRRSKG